MPVPGREQWFIPYSGVVTGLVADPHVGPETGWDMRASAPDHANAAEADGDVDLVLAFLNTVDVEQGTDELADAASWRAWALGHRLEPPGDGRGVASARAVRDALRAAVSDGLQPTVAPDGLPRTLPPEADRQRAVAPDAGGPIRVELHAGTPVLVAGDAVGAVLAASARLAVLGRWDRVKVCPADDCGWAFFDHSRNRSRTWCSMRVCGNRTKARNWRERARLRPA